jgi:hypothetical protein
MIAVELLQRGEFGTMVASAPPDIIARRITDVVGEDQDRADGFRSADDGQGFGRHVRRLKSELETEDQEI